MRKSLFSMVMLTALVLIVSACGGSGGGQGGSGGQITVGYAGPTLNNAFFVGLQKGVKDGAKKHDFKLKITNANGDAGEQFNQTQNLVNQGVDAVVLVPIDANGIVPAVQAANNADIPVFTLDRGSDGGELASVVETDNVKAGKKGRQLHSGFAQGA